MPVTDAAIATAIAASERVSKNVMTDTLNRDNVNNIKSNTQTQ